MQIKGTQVGPNLTIEVEFDDPDQMESFGAYFKLMVEEFAKSQKAAVFDVSSEEVPSSEDMGKLVNKFVKQGES